METAEKMTKNLFLGMICALGLLAATISVGQKVAYGADKLTWVDLGAMDYTTGEMTPALEEAIDEDVRLYGFVVPLDLDAERIDEFLLVPSAGMCIHVPAPPPNQMVLIKYPGGLPNNMANAPIWIEGGVEKTAIDDGSGEFGYVMEANNMEIIRLGSNRRRPPSKRQIRRGLPPKKEGPKQEQKAAE